MADWMTLVGVGAGGLLLQLSNWTNRISQRGDTIRNEVRLAYVDYIIATQHLHQACLDLARLSQNNREFRAANESIKEIKRVIVRSIESASSITREDEAAHNEVLDKQIAISNNLDNDVDELTASFDRAQAKCLAAFDERVRRYTIITVLDADLASLRALLLCEGSFPVIPSAAEDRARFDRDLAESRDLLGKLAAVLARRYAKR